MFTTGSKLIQKIALTALAMVGTEAAALSQSYSTNSNGQNGAGTPRPQIAMMNRTLKRYTGAQDYMYQTAELKSPVSVAHLPSYRGAGATYTGGLYYPHLKARQCYIMRYLSKDSDKDLMQNYRESLLQEGWQINDLQNSPRQLSAIRKDGLCLNLHVYPASKPGFKSAFEIKYLTTGSVQSQTM